ncbi:peptidase E [Candidatus Nomurabacteria bacterium]|nr:peptidase E [Candidatus Nomurabacteria bacterium]
MKILAIGGGEIGRPGFKIETVKIDKEIIRLSGKTKPKVLFIPTASSDSEGYISVVQKYYGQKLGCQVESLLLLNNKISNREIERKVFNSDVLYVGGGNTLKMMNVWRKRGLDKIIKKAVTKGIVLSGVSAGAICWFKYGSSDSRRFHNPKADLIRVSGLGFVNALFCPHYDVEKDRKPDLKKLMKKTPGIAIAVDNCCAIEVVDKNYRIVSSKNTANAYKIYWKDGKYIEQTIKKDKKFQPLETLLQKN